MNMAEQKYTVTTVLGLPSIQKLGGSMHLTDSQIATAQATALELSSNAALKNCNPFSLVKYCYQAARFNFSRPDCIYPVPYGANVQAQIGYKGFRELALRTGNYKTIDCTPVLECDHISRDRETGQIIVDFETDFNKTIGKDVVGYYAFAKDTAGEIVSSLYWSKEQCEAHGRLYSKSYNSIWASSFDKMAMKTVIKQLCSKLPSSPELQDAIKQDQIVYGGENEEDTYADNPNNIKEVDDGLEEVTFGE